MERPPGFDHARSNPIKLPKHVDAYRQIRALERLAEYVTDSVKKLSDVLYTECHSLGNPPPVGVLSIRNDEVSSEKLTRYRESQIN